MAQLAVRGREPKFASLRKGQSIESITLNEVIDLFKLPRQLGQFEDKLVTTVAGEVRPLRSS